MSIADALFGTTQQRVIGWIFGRPDRSFYLAELVKGIGSGTGAVQRELDRLVRSGLVTVRQVGNQRHFQANPGAPVFDELCGLALKTTAFVEPLRQALAPLGARLRAAFVYGSVARGQDTASSDIDVMLIGEPLSYGEVLALLEPMSARLGRSLSPTVYTPDEWASRRARDDHFVNRLMQQPRLWLVGSDHVL